MIVTSPNTHHDYIVDEELGSGSFGAVYRVHDGPNQYAMKIMTLPQGWDEATQRRRAKVKSIYEAERSAHEMLSKYPHCYEHILCLHDAFLTPDDAYLVTELMEGDLLDNPLPDELILNGIYQMIDAVRFLHSKGFAHRDIKPENYLRRGMDVKLGDLGFVCREGTILSFSRPQDQLQIPGCDFLHGTLLYMSPESAAVSTGLRDNRGTSLKAQQQSDMWSLGATIFTTVFGYPLIDENMTNDEYSDFMKGLTQDYIDELLNREAVINRGRPLPIDDIVQLIGEMMRINPTERITAREALDRFNEFDLEEDLSDDEEQAEESSPGKRKRAEEIPEPTRRLMSPERINQIRETIAEYQAYENPHPGHIENMLNELYGHLEALRLRRAGVKDIEDIQDLVDELENIRNNLLSL